MLTRMTAMVMAIARGAMTTIFILMMVLTLFQVINRYAIGLPVFWTEELIVFLLVWTTMLGLPVQLWLHQEIVVDFIEFRSAVANRIKQVIATASSIVFCVVLAWSGWEFAARGFNVTSPTMGLSRFWFFLPVAGGAALSVLALAVRRPEQSTGGFD